MTQWGAKNVRVNVAMAGLRIDGTAETVLAQQSVGGLPTHNWDSGIFAKAEDISGERMYDTILLKNELVMPAPCAASEWSRSSRSASRGATAAPNTRIWPRSVPTA